MTSSQQMSPTSRGRSGVDFNIIDADAHMTEPPELWQRVDAQFRDQVPRILPEHKGEKNAFFAFEDLVVRITPERAGASRDFERPGGWDPAERLKDMETDGIAAAALYTTYGFFLFGSLKADLQRECFRVYNDWVSEFCAYKPDRLHGLGLVSLFDIDKAVKELERCRTLRLKGALIWSSPPDGALPYSAPHYYKFWEAAQELDLPIALHTNTRPMAMSAYSRSEERGGAGAFYTIMVMEQSYLQDFILQLAFGGVFERYPKLRVICAEGDVSWMPYLMERADKYYASRSRRGHDLPMAYPPSTYFRRNVWISFIKDQMGLKVYKEAGLIDRIMWSTDYPHPASFFPDLLKVFREDFADVPEADKKKICHDNAAAFYGFEGI